MRKFSSYILIWMKGVGMGAADVRPGLSGGTIAFLTGIYQELIDSIRSIDLKAMKLLFTGKIGQFWKKINGNFLVAVLLGILVSFFSLAKLMTYLMVHHPVPLWAFFFGLIISSAFLILKDIKFNFSAIVSLMCGLAIGVAICLLSPAETPDAWWFIFLCGAIAICAMILPGISGSFILLLLGKYQYMLGALTALDFPTILLFAAGALLGIIAFSHFLSWLLKNYYNMAISLLSGIMIGSLVKVWPWQLVLENGVSRPTLPNNPDLLISSQIDFIPAAHLGHIPEAVIFAVIGILIVVTLELLSRKMSKKKEVEKVS